MASNLDGLFTNFWQQADKAKKGSEVLGVGYKSYLGDEILDVSLLEKTQAARYDEGIPLRESSTCNSIAW